MPLMLMPTTEEPATEMRLLTDGLRESWRVLARNDCVLRSECSQGRVFDDLHVECAAAVRCVPVSSDGPG